MLQPDRRPRALLVAVGMFALISAMWGGLLRIGWAFPALFPTMAAGHGPLMVCGFLGTLIGLERASALGYRWTFAAPAATALGALTLIAGLPTWMGALLITAGSLVVVAIFTVISRRQPELFNHILLLGAAVWFVGNLLWLLGASVSGIILWWIAFLVLTIAGERLELNRLLQPTAAVRAAFLAAVALFLTGPVISQFNYDLGWRVGGAGILALAVWLLVNDIARRTVRQQGLTRFIAVCLLSGYVWLGFGGALALSAGINKIHYYDALGHSVFLGFVITMIFGHAPVIFPAVLGLSMPFRTAFYAHLTLIHISLTLRVAGDLINSAPARQWGAMLNVVALLLFLANTLWSIRAGRQKPIISGPKRTP